jgi:hypothetical protein
MNWAITTVLVTAIAGNAAAADSVLTETARNPHNFTLKFDMYNFVNGGWRGDANFTISACPQASCFHLSGHVVTPLNSSSMSEGGFAIPGSPCELHFLEVPHGDYDSGDWRITLIGKGGKGCSSLPAGLPGVYKETD